MKKLRVGILDDSEICRTQLRAYLQADGDIEVVCEGASGENAVALLTEHRPELLVVDLSMPRMDGHATISHVMATAPLPILVVTGEPLGTERTAVFESIRRGALDLAEKPAGSDALAQAELRAAVRRLARIPVVRHVAGKLAQKPPVLPRPSRIPPCATRGEPGSLVIGIASSAGGPVALSALVGALTADLPVAVLVVQHLPESFLSAFADFLTGRTHLQVVRVLGPAALRPGHLYLSASDAHLVMDRPDRVTLSHMECRSGHRPSGDVLFESMARHAGARASGVVLSGMGEDGARGLLSLKKQGALCLAQDQGSAAVWGMPKVALEMGGAERALPPLGLAQVLSTWVRSEGKEQAS